MISLLTISKSKDRPLTAPPISHLDQTGEGTTVDRLGLASHYINNL